MTARGFSDVPTAGFKAALVGFASKGPLSTPTKITNSADLHLTFGSPHPEESDANMVYAAEQCLITGSEVLICRIADPALVRTAMVPIPANNNLVKIYSDVKGPYVFKKSQFFRWKVNGQLSPNTLVVLATGPEGIAAKELAAELNDQLVLRDGIEFFVHNNDYLGVKTTDRTKTSLELISVQDAMYGPWSSTGLGIGMEPAEKISSKKQDVYDLQMHENLSIDIVVSGSGNVSVDGVLQTIKLRGLEGRVNSVTDIVEYINTIELPSLPGGWHAAAKDNRLVFRTNHVGRDASLSIRSGYSAIAVFGFDTKTTYGQSPTNEAILWGSASRTGDVCFKVYADSPGLEGNLTKVSVLPDLQNETFALQVFNDGVLVEQWGQLTKAKESRYYVQDFINLVSKWIRIEDNTAIQQMPKSGFYVLGDPQAEGSIKGADGMPSEREEQEKILAGNAEEGTGVFTLLDKDYEFDAVAVPGHNADEVMKSLTMLCETRKNCLAVVDAPISLTDAKGWFESHTSDYIAAFWPWVRIRDSYNRRNVWVPPSGSVMAVIGRSDSIGAVWFPATGPLRGVVPGIIDVLKEEEPNDYCVNIIKHNKVNDSFAVTTQNTLAGNSIAVKRLLIYIEKNLRKSIDSLRCDDWTGDGLRKVCDYVLSEVRKGRGIHNYTVQAEEDTKGILRARIGIQPREASKNYYINLKLNRLIKADTNL